MVVVGAFSFSGTAAYAADDPLNEIIGVITENLSVDDVWLTGEILHIIVTEKTTGISQKLEMNLRDYAGAGDEYVTVQAIDRAGNISNSIQFKNPFYIPTALPQPSDPAGDGNPGASEHSTPNVENPVSNGRPFTPDGTGTVVDNVTDGDGKEFFSISTEDGNIFYLIVDRQRNTDNVYLLNAVTEQDLMSLAKEGDGKPIGTVQEPPLITPDTPEPTPSAEPAPPPPAKSGDSGTIIFIIIAVLAVGGAGYYFKIVRPKQSGIYDDDDESDEFDDDTETDLEDDGEDGDDE
jgi:hypothetical protein